MQSPENGEMISPRMGMVLLGTNNTSYPHTIGLKGHSQSSFTPMGLKEQARLKFPSLKRSKMVNIITMNSPKLISGGKDLGMGQSTMSALLPRIPTIRLARTRMCPVEAVEIKW